MTTQQKAKVTAYIQVPLDDIRELVSDCCVLDKAIGYWASDVRVWPLSLRYPVKPGDTAGFKVTKSVATTISSLDWARAISLMIEHYPEYWLEFKRDLGWVELVDVLIQLAVFSEVIYG